MTVAICLDMGVDTHVNMRVDMRVAVCIDMHVNMRVDIPERAFEKGEVI